MSITINKYVAEVRSYYFDFSQLDEIIAGDILSSVTSVTCSPSGLTIGVPSIVSKTVKVTISGGSVGTYTVICIITTSSGAVLEGQGMMVVS